MLKSAFISDCRQFRYRLGRTWGEGRKVAFIMLNPSTADASEDDPTIRRCMNFAKAWGFGGMEVANLFAFRTAFPLALFEAQDPVGPYNDRALLETANNVDEIVCAWGAHGDFLGQDSHARGLLEDYMLYCLKLTAKGQPGHPLYLKASLRPIPYAWPTP